MDKRLGALTLGVGRGEPLMKRRGVRSPGIRPG
jgi:hypothetical protein